MRVCQCKNIQPEPKAARGTREQMEPPAAENGKEAFGGTMQEVVGSNEMRQLALERQERENKRRFKKQDMG